MAELAARREASGGAGAWREWFSAGSSLRAMAQTGGAALLSSGLNSLAIKLVASGAGPSGVALLATLQQSRQTALVAGTLNGQTALIQGASSLQGIERREFMRTAAALLAAAALAAAILMLLAPGAWTRIAGLPPQNAPLFRGLTAAVILSCGYVFLTALLNALGQVSRLALLQLAAPAAFAILAAPAAAALRGGGTRLLLAALTVSSGTAMAAAALLLEPFRASILGWFRGPGVWWSGQAARRFLSLALSTMSTGLLGSILLISLRGRIARTQGLEVTGQFDAAWTISMNHVTLVLASLQTYYLPLLARTRPAAERATLIAAVLVPAALGASLAIAGIALLKPWVLSVFYSHDFVDGARYLRWTLLGDYLKVASWVLSAPMLASADVRAFVASDLAAWGTFGAAALALSRWMPAADATAIAFVAMYAVHLAIAAVYARRRHAFTPDARTAGAWLGGLGLVSAASAIGWNAP